jgi:hypothetical protein
MLQIRFLYKDNLYGEWADAASGDYLYPNPEYADKVLCVQTRETADLQRKQGKPKTFPDRGRRPRPIPNRVLGVEQAEKWSTAEAYIESGND